MYELCEGGYRLTVTHTDLKSHTRLCGTAVTETAIIRVRNFMQRRPS
jgi:hypothetical protein